MEEHGEGADLVLARDALRGVKAAIDAIDAMIGVETAASFARVRPGSFAIDEAKQLVRTRILAGDEPKLALYGGKGPLRAWIRTLATRTLLNAAERAPDEILLGERVLEAETNNSDPEREHMKRLYRSELRAAFAEAVESRLTDRQRDLLRHALVEELSVDEIGRLYDVHKATAARWVAAARTALEKAMRAILAAKLAVKNDELESIARLVASQLDLSLSRVLADHASATLPQQPQARQPRQQPPANVGRAGRYAIQRPLGSGGMGAVFVARDPELERLVAVKILHAFEEREQKRLLEEARAMARLSHPNVVAVYDVGVEAGRIFVAMELVEGTTLRGWLDAEPRSEREVLAVIAAAGRGLAAAHAAGLVHRDFKPDNVLVGDDGRVRVSDFGLATREGTLAASGGTPLYMAPEQYGLERVTQTADQYAFAVTAYEALVGQLPFLGAGIDELRASKLRGIDPHALARLSPSLREPLARSLSVDPQKRFAQMNDLLSGLRRRRAPVPVPAPKSLPPQGDFGRDARTTTILRIHNVDDEAWRAFLEAHELEGTDTDTDTVRFDPGTRTFAPDRAAKAARVALAAVKAFPEARIAIATSNEPLAPHAAHPIVLDAATAALLGPAFRVTQEEGDDVRRLEGEGRELGPFVGRTSELRALVDAFDRAARGAAMAALIVGPAGIGKSRLGNEVEHRLGAEVWSGRADAFSGRAALQLVRSFASSLGADVVGALDLPPEGRAAMLELAGATESSSGARSRAHAHPLSFGDWVRAGIVALVREACARGPLVIRLEDVHWADPASMLVIDHVLSHCVELPLLVIATARPELDDVFPGLWSSQPLVRVELHELGSTAADALVRGLGAKDADVERILASAGGNPFLLEQTARLSREKEKAAIAAVPLTEAMMGRLGSDARAVLRAASVLGDRFGAKDVAAVLSWPEDRVSREIDSLVRGQLVVANNGGIEEGAFGFVHALLRNAAYATLSDSDRSAAHERAGRWLEDRAEPSALAVAEHFARGADRARATVHFERAARQALEGHDFSGAVALANRGLEGSHESSSPLAARLWLARGTAEHWAGAFADAVTSLQRAMSLAEPSSDTWFAAIGRLAMATTRVKDGPDDHDLARALPDPIPSTDVACGAAACIATKIADEVGGGGVAAKIIARVRELAPHVKDEWVLARYHFLEATIAEADGELGMSVHHGEQVVAHFARAGAQREAAVHRANLGFHRLVVGDFERAAHDLREAMREGRRLGVRDAENVARLNLIATLTGLGRADEALPLARRSVEACAGDARLERSARLDCSLTLLALGRVDEALAEVEHVVAGGPDAQQRIWVEGMAAKAEMLFVKGDANAALATARTAMDEDAKTTGRRSITVTAPYAFALAARALGKVDEARTAAREGRALVLERAAKIKDEAVRASYLKVRVHAALLSLADELG